MGFTKSPNVVKPVWFTHLGDGSDVLAELSGRDRAFLREAKRYAAGEAPGFPGHNVILLAAKLAKALEGAGMIDLDPGLDPE